MKKTYIALLLIMSGISFSQQGYDPDYFLGNYIHCNTENAEAKKLFTQGAQILNLNYKLNPKYLWPTAEIFARSVEKDTTFCDAYFFAGYTLNLLHKYRESFAFHKVADSLSPKPLFLYKHNLAAVCLKIGLVLEAKKYYEQIVANFTENPEGYYGLALTATSTGEVEKGLENIKKADELYGIYLPKKRKDVHLLYGILLTMNGKFSESIEHFEKCNAEFKKLDDFNYNYSYSLLKKAQAGNDEKMKKKAIKTFEKIKDKSIVKPEVANEFKL